MEGLGNGLVVMLVFAGAAAFLWVIDKIFGLFGEKTAHKLRHSSKVPWIFIGISVIGAVVALNALEGNRSTSSGYSDDDSGCVGSMRC
jgi:hypothetical protein